MENNYNCHYFHSDDIMIVISISEKGISAYKSLSISRGCSHAQGGVPLRCYYGSRYSRIDCGYACSAYDKCVGYSQGRGSNKNKCNLFVSSSSCPSYFRGYRGKAAHTKTDLVGTGPKNYNCKAKNGSLKIKIQ